MSTQEKANTGNKNTEKASAGSDQIAVMIAVLLDRDPTAAAQVKQYIPAARLAQLLQLAPASKV